MEDNVEQSTSNHVQERVQLVTQETEQSHEANEHLLTKVDFLESRLVHLSDSNTDLSCRLLHSEEERLKITKELLEEKLQTNKLREQHEKDTFALKAEILKQVEKMKKLEQQRETLSTEVHSTEKENSIDDLRVEFNTSDKNVQTLVQEVGLSEELKAELQALANAQDALRRQMEEKQLSARSAAEGLQGELEGVKALISHMTQSRVKTEDVEAIHKEQKTMEKTLLENQDEMKDLLQRIRSNNQEQQRKLEERVAALSINHQESNTREQNTAYMCCQSQVKEVEEQNSKLQLQLKELNNEYRVKLVCYLRDLSDYIDRLGHSETSTVQKKMRPFVDEMLQDVRSSFRVREVQLSSAALYYKKRLQRVFTAHHALLVTYRAQREQILAKPGCDLDPGPPEADFSLEAVELKDGKEKEDKARLEGPLQVVQEQVAQRGKDHSEMD